MYTQQSTTLQVPSWLVPYSTKPLAAASFSLSVFGWLICIWRRCDRLFSWPSIYFLLLHPYLVTGYTWQVVASPPPPLCSYSISNARLEIGRLRWFDLFVRWLWSPLLPPHIMPRRMRKEISQDRVAHCHDLGNNAFLPSSSSPVLRTLQRWSAVNRRIIAPRRTQCTYQYMHCAHQTTTIDMMTKRKREGGGLINGSHDALSGGVFKHAQN